MLICDLSLPTLSQHCVDETLSPFAHLILGVSYLCNPIIYLIFSQDPIRANIDIWLFIIHFYSFSSDMFPIFYNVDGFNHTMLKVFTMLMNQFFCLFLFFSNLFPNWAVAHHPASTCTFIPRTDLLSYPGQIYCPGYDVRLICCEMQPWLHCQAFRWGWVRWKRCWDSLLIWFGSHFQVCLHVL